MNNNVYFYETKIGTIGIRENSKYITDIFFSKKDTNDNIEETELIKECFLQLKQYFEGNRRSFDLPIQPKGTEFQKMVWNELSKIPYGETKSYKDIALAIGNEKACRAVGMANNKNPIPIIIPCHRVIGSNKKLVGYSGGIDVKEKLLNIENINLK